MKLSPEQKSVIAQVELWLQDVWQDIPKVERRSSVPQYISIGGYAGTGKTTIIVALRKILNKRFEQGKYTFLQKKKKPILRVGFCSFTGKASQILGEKLQASNAVFKKDIVGTIHSLMYEPEKIGDRVIDWNARNTLPVDCIIVDEASMLTKSLWEDLLSYKLPIIAVGDHGQLPPIDGDFNLMEDPKLQLTTIFRQEQDNPILQLAEWIRENNHAPVPQTKEYSDFITGVVDQSRLQIFTSTDSMGKETVGDIIQNYSQDTMILCGYNNTRKAINQQIRAHIFEFDEPDWDEIQKYAEEDMSDREIQEKILTIPKRKDRVLCLKNNNRRGIYNGMLGTISSIEAINKKIYSAHISFDSGLEYQTYISADQFGANTTIDYSEIPRINFETGELPDDPDRKDSKFETVDLFDFGYAMTVHKAQGSQAKQVLLFAERMKRMEDNIWGRWLYTAVTRAEERLIMIVQSSQ
jgi:exodeoxyribonuclease-5